MSKILLVEDENDIRDVYAELLTDSGFEVIQAGDGETAWNIAKVGDWDLLLLDIMLPKMDGIEILTHIKSEQGLRSKPVVLLTNLEHDSIVDRCLKLGAADYIVKSNVDPQGMLDAVAKHISNA